MARGFDVHFYSTSHSVADAVCDASLSFGAAFVRTFVFDGSLFYRFVDSWATDALFSLGLLPLCNGFNQPFLDDVLLHLQELVCGLTSDGILQSCNIELVADALSAAQLLWLHSGDNEQATRVGLGLGDYFTSVNSRILQSFFQNSSLRDIFLANAKWVAKEIVNCGHVHESFPSVNSSVSSGATMPTEGDGCFVAGDFSGLDSNLANGVVSAGRIAFVCPTIIELFSFISFAKLTGILGKFDISVICFGHSLFSGKFVANLGSSFSEISFQELCSKFDLSGFFKNQPFVADNDSVLRCRRACSDGATSSGQVGVNSSPVDVLRASSSKVKGSSFVHACEVPDNIAMFSFASKVLPVGANGLVCCGASGLERFGVNVIGSTGDCCVENTISTPADTFAAIRTSYYPIGYRNFVAEEEAVLGRFIALLKILLPQNLASAFILLWDFYKKFITPERDLEFGKLESKIVDCLHIGSFEGAVAELEKGGLFDDTFFKYLTIFRNFIKIVDSESPIYSLPFNSFCKTAICLLEDLSLFSNKCNHPFGFTVDNLATLVCALRVVKDCSLFIKAEGDLLDMVKMGLYLSPSSALSSRASCENLPIDHIFTGNNVMHNKGSQDMAFSGRFADNPAGLVAPAIDSPVCSSPVVAVCGGLPLGLCVGRAVVLASFIERHFPYGTVFGGDIFALAVKLCFGEAVGFCGQENLLWLAANAKAVYFVYSSGGDTGFTEKHPFLKGLEYFGDRLGVECSYISYVDLCTHTNFKGDVISGSGELPSVGLVGVSCDEGSVLKCDGGVSDDALLPRPTDASLDADPTSATLPAGSNCLAYGTFLPIGHPVIKPLKNQERFPKVLSPTAVAELVICPVKFYLRRIMGLRDRIDVLGNIENYLVRSDNKDRIFGNAFHAGCELLINYLEFGGLASTACASDDRVLDGGHASADLANFDVKIVGALQSVASRFALNIEQRLRLFRGLKLVGNVFLGLKRLGYQLLPECSVSCNFNGLVVNARADLIAVRGRDVIVFDYKTGGSRFFSREKQGYGVQMSLAGICLEAGQNSVVSSASVSIADFVYFSFTSSGGTYVGRYESFVHGSGSLVDFLNNCIYPASSGHSVAVKGSSGIMDFIDYSKNQLSRLLSIYLGDAYNSPSVMVDENLGGGNSSLLSNPSSLVSGAGYVKTPQDWMFTSDDLQCLLMLHDSEIM